MERAKERTNEREKRETLRSSRGTLSALELGTRKEEKDERGGTRRTEEEEKERKRVSRVRDLESEASVTDEGR